MEHIFDPKDYKLYMEQDFRHRWLKPQMLYDQLKKYKSSKVLTVKKLGKSEEERDIYKLEYGQGPVKVLIWSQMHGNEPTATMALIDLFNFLSHSGKYDKLREYIHENLSLVFIPMLNPDGAENFTRRNAIGIDLNRDAQSSTAVETKLFMEVFHSIRPHFAFNLHDQRNFFSVGSRKNPATLSFLAPSANPELEVTTSQKSSMQLITVLAELVEELYPGHCGKYAGDFYPGAFGEFCQSRETACVLIESGAYPNDEFRDVSRKLNFLILLRAFALISSNKFQDLDISNYLYIPQNGACMMDLIVRDCKLGFSQRAITTDLGFMLEEKVDKDTNELNRNYILKDIGDLSHHSGFMEYNGGEVFGLDEADINQKADFTIKFKNEQLKFDKGRLV